MRASDLLRDVEGEWVGDPDVEVKGISTDSRTAKTSDAYVALRGAKSDGHTYLASALEHGAVLAVVDRDDLDLREWPVAFVAQDVRKAIATLGRALYGDPAQRMKMLGITGTNGKTSTVYLLRAALEALGWSAASCGTLGFIDPEGQRSTGFTTPDIPILMPWLKRCADLGVAGVAMEVSSHALQLGRTDSVEFDVAAFTNFSRDHLDFHRDLDDYFAQKAKLFRERTKPEGRCIFNADDPKIATLADSVASERGEERVIRIRKGDTYRVVDETVDGLLCEFRLRGGPARLRSKLIGDYNAFNLCTVALALEALDFEPSQIVDALSGIGAIPGRMARVGAEEGPAVFVDYAHTPAALEAALGALRRLLPEGARLSVVFGCGGDRDAGKRPLMGRAAEAVADRVVITSDNPRHEDAQVIAAQVQAGTSGSGVEVVLDRREAIHHAILDAGPSDIILVAGKGHETTQVIGTETRPFDDHVAVAELLRESRHA